MASGFPPYGCEVKTSTVTKSSCEGDVMVKVSEMTD